MDNYIIINKQIKNKKEQIENINSQIKLIRKEYVNNELRKSHLKVLINKKTMLKEDIKILQGKLND